MSYCRFIKRNVSKYRSLVRSGEMESLLFALISIVILFPILYFLPIGITNRGKMTIVVVTFFIVALGLLASPLFPLWQTILVEVLIVAIATYLLDKKLVNMLYASEEDNDFDVFEEEDRTKSVLDGMNESYAHIASSDKVSKQPQINEPEQFEASQTQIETSPPTLKDEQVEEDLVDSEFNSAIVALEEVAVAVQVEDSNKINLEDEGYLGEIEDYLTTDTDNGQTDIIVANEQTISISDGDVSDLEQQIIEALSSFDDGDSYIDTETKPEEGELPELSFENDFFDLEEIESELNALEPDEIIIEDNSSEINELAQETNDLENINTHVFELDEIEDAHLAVSIETHSVELDELDIEDFSAELLIESDDLEVDELETDDEVEIDESPIVLNKNVIDELEVEEEFELEELQTDEDSIELEEDKKEESNFKFEFKFNDDDEDDDAFWKMLAEDDEEDKKKSKSSDKLERMWEKTGLAK